MSSYVYNSANYIQVLVYAVLDLDGVHPILYTPIARYNDVTYIGTNALVKQQSFSSLSAVSVFPYAISGTNKTLFQGGLALSQTELLDTVGWQGPYYANQYSGGQMYWTKYYTYYVAMGEFY